MYPDESSRVLVYWLKVITCLGVVCIVDCESIFDCMLKSFGSSLPFACLFALYVVLLLLRWSSIWWEHMWEVLVVNRGEMIPLHSLLGLDFLSFLGFSLGLWPMYSSVFRFLYDFSKMYNLFLFLGIVVCAVISYLCDALF